MREGKKARVSHTPKLNTVVWTKECRRREGRGRGKAERDKKRALREDQQAKLSQLLP